MPGQNGTHRLRVGIDVGGTFTDIVAVDEQGALFYAKVPSTPADQSVGVVAAIERLLDSLGLEASAIQRIAHGTTVATNTLLEGRGARTALLTTKGFRDILHIGRQARPDLYDLKAKHPTPLVPRRYRRGVTERTRHTGQVEVPLNVEEVREILAEWLAEGIESIAISFLHSYANPENERQAASIIRQEAPSLPLSVSSEILPEFREFERTSTTVLNAYVRPVTERYLQRLSQRLETVVPGVGFTVMQSSGGMMGSTQAAERSVHTLLSGPASGVLAASYLAEKTGYRDCITADIGGTSFDVSIVADSKPSMRTEGVIGNYPVKIPHIDIHTIGAGGGSIAWIDKGGALRIGPRSAGADPGPICYGKGGTEPTVTDAHAVLGRFGGKNLLEGRIVLDVDNARRAIEEKIAKPLGMSVTEAAEGMLRVANASMVRAIRVMTVERGLDPRRFALVAYGGAGPLHAADLARQLGVSRVIVPLAPGNFSAFGLLVAPIRYDSVATHRVAFAEMAPETIESIYQRLEEEVRGRLAQEGFDAANCRLERQADVRYIGQAFELTVDVPAGPFGQESQDALAQGFHALHESLYGFSKPSDPLELINLRVSGLGYFPPVDLRYESEKDEPEPVAVEDVCFDNEWRSTPIYAREGLPVGAALMGPAIIKEAGATTVVPPSCRARVDELGNIIIELTE